MITSDVIHGLNATIETIRAMARTTIFVLKVLPMLPSRWLNPVTPKPRVATLTFPSSRGPVAGDLYRPADDGPHPGMVVCLGVVPFDVNHPQVPRLGEALARSGFAALLYWSPAMRDLRLDTADIDDIALAYDCLVTQDFVDSRRSGLFGTCVGGSFALMAAANPLIRDHVSFVGAFAPYSSMATMTVGIASSTRESGTGRAHWPVDPLTREVYARTLADLLRLTRGESQTGANEGTVGPEPGHPLLAEMSAEDAEAALRKLPVTVRDELDRLSPLNYLSDIHAPAIVFGHDRDDTVIPVSESRQLRRALAGRHGVRYTEYAMFQHADPTKRKLPLPQLAWQLGRFYLSLLPLFRQACRGIPPLGWNRKQSHDRGSLH
jgi:hypothetical protein